MSELFELGLSEFIKLKQAVKSRKELASKAGTFRERKEALKAINQSIDDLRSRLVYYFDLDKKIEEKDRLISKLIVETGKMKDKYVDICKDTTEQEDETA
ncbi:MAG: hypothetical protein V2I33_23175 [Kangiellaceae bacterium]|jgi:hypothetical protein|nr:hypothetical protein [Kangiellaceae bacterium]